MIFNEYTLIDMVDDTSSVFPAGDWIDSRPHLLTLYNIARHITCPKYGKPDQARPPRCLEIGVRQGPTTMAILTAMKRTGGRLISLDIDPVETAVAARLIEEAGLSEFWEFHLQSSDDFYPTFSGELDLLWIDGDHRDPQPTRDFEHFAPFVRTDGVIAMHDFFVEPWREDEDGVRKCVEAVRQTGQYEIMVLPYTYGCVLMRKLWA